MRIDDHFDIMSLLDGRDILRFINHILDGVEHFDRPEIMINNVWEIVTPDSDTMTTIKLLVQYFDHDNKDRDTQILIRLNRAKDFSCSNMTDSKCKGENASVTMHSAKERFNYKTKTTIDDLPVSAETKLQMICDFMKTHNFYYTTKGDFVVDL